MADPGQVLKGSFPVGTEILQAHVAIASSSAETTLLAAPGGGFTNRVSCIEMNNETATAVTVTFRTSTAGTIVRKYLLPASASAVLEIPHTIRCAENGAFTAQLSVATVTVNFNVYGYKKKFND